MISIGHLSLDPEKLQSIKRINLLNRNHQNFIQIFFEWIYILIDFQIIHFMYFSGTYF
jgi:hypothetical protein